MNIAHLLKGHEKDLGGGFVVRRYLPAAAKQAVGPFIFFDHFGPVDVPADADHDVRPHPHIGLATVTYLFEGAMEHRDSLGTLQRIEPGAINWMTAGRGIVHSERRPEDLRQQTHVNHGLQRWTALPLHDEEIEPSFSHTPAPAFSRKLYLDLWLPAGSRKERILQASADREAGRIGVVPGDEQEFIPLPPAPHDSALRSGHGSVDPANLRPGGSACRRVRSDRR